jgi:hypothetical protein
MADCGFDTNIDKATPTNFELVFPVLPQQITLAANNELSLNLQGVVLPSLSLNPGEVGWQDTVHKIAQGPLQFEQMQVQFIVDSKFLNWKVLFQWMTYISNNKDKMMEFHSRFAVDSALSIQDNFQKEIMRIGFVGMWPVNLQETSFSTREAEITIESSATFVYDYFELKS